MYTAELAWIFACAKLRSMKGLYRPVMMCSLQKVVHVCVGWGQSVTNVQKELLQFEPTYARSFIKVALLQHASSYVF